MTSKGETISALDFTDERVLVTGGALGIGKATALKFLKLGATVIVLDKDVNCLEKLVSNYPAIQTVTVDLKNWDKTRKAVESVLPIHHLANNAGISEFIPFVDVALNNIDMIFDINFKAVLNVAQVVAKGMIANNIKNGTIVNISSNGDELVYKLTSIYSASKAAVAMLTKSMAVELAKHGIRVNCVGPGLTNTEMLQEKSVEFKKENLGSWYERLLFPVACEPESMADAIVFLSSPMSSRITATKLLVDQGFSVQ